MQNVNLTKGKIAELANSLGNLTYAEWQVLSDLVNNFYAKKINKNNGAVELDDSNTLEELFDWNFSRLQSG